MKPEGLQHVDYGIAYLVIAVMFAVLGSVVATIWVVGDVQAMRSYELHVCGESDCNPYRWALAVVLLPIVAIPLYLRFRRDKLAQHQSFIPAGD